ncbi:MAG: hypothetical protein GY788_28505 [bacterium]|nr:hypothetical protein [bacterium]
MTDQPLQDPKTGKFLPGNNGNPTGRPRGSKNKISENFLRELSADFEVHGKQAIQDCRTLDPVAYVRVVAGLLPKDVNLNLNPFDGVTNDELRAELQQLRPLIEREFAAAADPEGDLVDAGAGPETTH